MRAVALYSILFRESTYLESSRSIVFRKILDRCGPILLREYTGFESYGSIDPREAIALENCSTIIFSECKGHEKCDNILLRDPTEPESCCLIVISGVYGALRAVAT